MKITYRTNLWKTCPVKITRAPIAWAKWLFGTIKYSYQRATRGYSEYDLWHLNDYYAEMIANSLKHFSDVANGYPNKYAEEDDPGEKWARDIKVLSKHFDSWGRDDDFLWEDYWKRVDELRKTHPNASAYGLEHIDPVLLALSEKAIKDSKAFEKEKHEDVCNGFEILGTIFPMLWD